MESDKNVVLRFDILYGYNSANENNGFFGKITSGREIKVNSSQIRQPLLIDDIGRAVLLLLEKNLSGVYHLAGLDRVSKFDLGRSLESLIRKESLLIPITEEAQIANRPKNTTLNIKKAEDIGMRFSSIDEGIKIIKEQYESNK